VENRTWKNPRRLLNAFVLINLFFLALDIFFAHSVNAFHHPAEWIPFYYSLMAPLVLSLLFFFSRRRDYKNSELKIIFIIGLMAVIIGMAGLFFHLNSTFFKQQTIKNLVYTAPFVAPLAYSGLGFLLLLNLYYKKCSKEWAQWVLFFGAGGFLGNFILALCDHAQNGFFMVTEWIPVITSAMAIGFLLPYLIWETEKYFWKWTFAVLLVQIMVGFAGFVLHFLSLWNNFESFKFSQIIFGAPIFAPLLFVNLSLLCMLGLWSVKNKN